MQPIGKSSRLFIILIIALVVIGGIVLSNILSFHDIKQAYIKQAQEEQSAETNHAASQIEHHVLEVRDELLTLSKFPQMETLNVSQCSGSMKIIHQDINGLIDSLLRTDAAGNVIEYSSDSFADYAGLNIKDKDYFKIPKETSEPYISEAIRQGTSNQLIISTSIYETTEYTPYPNYQGTFKGVLFSIIDLETLYNLYIHPVLQEDTHYFILFDTVTNKTIMRSQGLPSDLTLPDSLKSKQEDIPGLGTVLYSSANIAFGEDQWRLVILTPVKNISSEFGPIQRRHIISLIVIVIILGIVFAAFMRVYKSKEEAETKLEQTHLTLEKLGIKIGMEGGRYHQADISLEPGQAYLIKDDQETQAYDLFLDTLNKGYPGLGLTREDPELVKQRYGLKNTSFIWLSKQPDTNVPAETAITNIHALLREFIKKTEQSVILIDRLDYLYNMNDPGETTKALLDLKDLITKRKSIIILAGNQDLLPPTQLRILESECVDLFGEHLKKSVSLSEQELSMLRFINERNIENKLVSYKDITAAFKITKPTTRAKITALQQANLVSIEQKGRYKAIKITSSGRRFL